MTKPNTICFICKKDIYRIPSRLTNRHFCSYICKNKYYSEVGYPLRSTNNYRKLVELTYNIKLSTEDIIHHKDGNHNNNNINNLLITTKGEHTKIHQKGILKNSVMVECLNCNKNFIVCLKHFLRGNGKYCSNKCRFSHWKIIAPKERKLLYPKKIKEIKYE